MSGNVALFRFYHFKFYNHIATMVCRAMLLPYQCNAGIMLEHHF